MLHLGRASFKIFVCQVSTVLPTVATNTKPTRLSIADTKLQSSYVPGEKSGCRHLRLWCSVDGYTWKKEKVVLPARMWSQEHKRGKSGKLSGADCQNAHMTVTYGSNGEDGFSRHDPANAPTCDTQLQYHTDLWCFSSLLFWQPQNHVNNPVSTLKVKYDNQTITVRFRTVIKTRERSALDHLKTYFGKKQSSLTKKKILWVKKKISNQTERFHDRSQR